MKTENEITTIRVSKKTRSLIEKAKLYPRETHEDVIKRLLEAKKQ